MPPVILAKDLYKCYPGSPPVLRGVNISVEPGEIVAIMGPSGCGKSTMLHVLGMLHTPDSGTLEVLNTNVLPLSREETAAFRRGNMGFVMQSCNLFDHSTVFENVEFPLIYEGVPPEERWERVIRALDLVRLSARVHYRSNRLSGGEQQRVAIARAMVNNPRILLADEPTGALDFRTSKAVMDNFRTLAHEGGVAMVVVTHDSNVAKYCDTVYTLEDGVLVCQKREPLPVIPASGEGTGLLSGPKRHMNAAYVTARFPQPTGIAAVQDVLKLYEAGLLARVYSTKGSKLLSFDAAPFGLPLAVRRIGLSNAPKALLSFLRHLRGTSCVAWGMWHKLPLQNWYSLPKLLKRVWDFSCGALLAGWSITDTIEHLHADSAGSPATAAWVASRLTGIPFSFQVRASDLPSAIGTLPLQAADAAFVCCDCTDTLEKVRAACPLIAADTFTVLPPMLPFPLADSTDDADDADEQKGTDTSLNAAGATRESPATSGTTLPKDNLRLLVAGHIASRKGCTQLLRACARVRKAGIPLHLTIAGKGPGQWYLRWLRRFLGLHKIVTLCGHIPHERMQRLFQEASVFVAPDHYPTNVHDRQPTALLEAMECGLAIVATDLAPRRDLLRHGDNALLISTDKADSTQSLTDALTELFQEPERVQLLGAAAQHDALHNFEHNDGPSALGKLLLTHRK